MTYTTQRLRCHLGQASHQTRTVYKHYDLAKPVRRQESLRIRLLTSKMPSARVSVSSLHTQVADGMKQPCIKSPLLTKYDRDTVTNTYLT